MRKSGCDCVEVNVVHSAPLFWRAPQFGFLKIYLAALGFSCSTQDLPSLLRHVRFLVVAHELLVVASGL